MRLLQSKKVLLEILTNRLTPVNLLRQPILLHGRPATLRLLVGLLVTRLQPLGKLVIRLQPLGQHHIILVKPHLRARLKIRLPPGPQTSLPISRLHIALQLHGQQVGVPQEKPCMPNQRLGQLVKVLQSQQRQCIQLRGLHIGILK